MNKKFFYGIFGVLLFFSLLSSCSRPQKSGIDLDEIDTAKDPVQEAVTSNEPILIETKESRYTLTPKADYQLAGVVVSKETYSYDWNSEISPVDLAIVWGKLAEDENEKYVSFSQRNRWYFYEYKPESPLDNSYIISHSSNNHVIPATKNIALALKKIGERDKVILEGLLVNVNGTYKGKKVYWNTSLTRQDTGNGSCELFYVTKAKINTDIYE